MTLCKTIFRQSAAFILSMSFLIPDTHQRSQNLHSLINLLNDVMVFITKNISFVGLIFTVYGNSIFLKNQDFEDMFCVDKMIPRGLKRSLNECASLCSLYILCTGFFYDDDKYCFLTEEHLSDVNICSFREGHYYTNMGRSLLFLHLNKIYLYKCKKSTLSKM